MTACLPQSLYLMAAQLDGPEAAFGSDNAAEPEAAFGSDNAAEPDVACGPDTVAGFEAACGPDIVAGPEAACGPGTVAKSDLVSGINMASGLNTGHLFSLLLKETGMEVAEWKIKKEEQGRPYGLLNGKRVGTSIAHCPGLLVGALYLDGETGVDVESAERRVSEGLWRRMMHPDETGGTMRASSPIQCWTLKESVLKYLGSGLRIPMRQVVLQKKEEGRFYANYSQRNISVVSFLFRNYWISLAFGDNRPESG